MYLSFVLLWRLGKGCGGWGVRKSYNVIEPAWCSFKYFYFGPIMNKTLWDKIKEKHVLPSCSKDLPGQKSMIGPTWYNLIYWTWSNDWHWTRSNLLHGTGILLASLPPGDLMPGQSAPQAPASQPNLFKKLQALMWHMYHSRTIGILPANIM